MVLGLLLLASHSVPQPQIGEVTTSMILGEISNLSRLAGPPVPWHRSVQASSYDRASKTPGNEAWFANGDAGQFLRTEGDETVMVDWKGPGALVRLWTANATGTISFYFDGEAEPRIRGRMDEIMRGAHPDFPGPLAEKPQRGWNFYHPLPFAKSLKVTVKDEEEGDATGSLYYLANGRIYDPAVKVRTWTKSEQPFASPGAASPVEEVKSEKNILPGETLSHRLSTNRPHEIVEWEVTLKPEGVDFPKVSKTPDWQERKELHPLQSALAALEVRMTFDGARTVSAPLGHFFGSPDLVTGRLQTLLTSVNEGRLQSRLVMPFQKVAVLEIINHGKLPITVSSRTLHKTSLQGRWTLHAQFSHHRGPTRPFRDMTFMEAKGQGRYVGTVLQIQNPASQWWGEGDEKVWVDGESFPSWFGTGTEDYFGYAWCDPTPFSSLFVAQPHAMPPTNAGHTGNVRWHILDDIPFRSALKFQMEMWHWADVQARYSATSFWYAPVKESLPALEPANLDFTPIYQPPGVEGALEGEGLTVRKNGGITQIQSGFNDLSRGFQLWWTEAPVGSVLEIDVPVAEAGTYEIKASLCHAKDYGIHQISVNGKVVGDFDFYNDIVVWKEIDLGTHQLTAGANTIKVKIIGHNPKADQMSMFGLDYLLLKKEG